MPFCYYCNAELDARKPVRGDVCPSCGRDVKVCLNCMFYDEGAHNKCREPQAEWVKEKDRANFCEYFRFPSRPGKTGKAGPSREQSARSKLDDLFKKKDT